MPAGPPAGRRLGSPCAASTRLSAADPPVRPLLAAYYRLGHLVRELMKFGVVGGFAFVVDVGLFNLLLHATDKPLTSKTVSTVVATTVAYAGNRYWTFRRAQPLRRTPGVHPVLPAQRRRPG